MEPYYGHESFVRCEVRWLTLCLSSELFDAEADKMPYRSTEMNQIAGLMIGTVMDLALLTRQ
jgi:hypothetical protein